IGDRTLTFPRGRPTRTRRSKPSAGNRPAPAGPRPASAPQNDPDRLPALVAARLNLTPYAPRQPDKGSKKRGPLRRRPPEVGLPPIPQARREPGGAYSLLSSIHGLSRPRCSLPGRTLPGIGHDGPGRAFAGDTRGRRGRAHLRWARPRDRM